MTSKEIVEQAVGSFNTYNSNSRDTPLGIREHLNIFPTSTEHIVAIHTSNGTYIAQQTTYGKDGSFEQCYDRLATEMALAGIVHQYEVIPHLKFHQPLI